MPDKPDNVRGITADRKRCRLLVESSLMPVTALVPKLGYQRAAEIASEAFRTGRTIREVVLAENLISDTELDSLLDLTSMTHPSADDPAPAETDGSLQHAAGEVSASPTADPLMA